MVDVNLVQALAVFGGILIAVVALNKLLDVVNKLFEIKIKFRYRIVKKARR